MTTNSADQAQHLGDRPPASPVKMTHYQVVQRLTHAAARPGTSLLDEAAALADGWAVLVDPVAGAFSGDLQTAGCAAVHAAAHPQAHPHLTVRRVGAAVLVLGPGASVPASRIPVIARTTVELLRVRAQQADKMRGIEQRMHTAVLRLLLRGEHRLAADVAGCVTAVQATMYRLTGSPRATQAAYQVLWRTAQLNGALSQTHRLVCLDGTELVVVDLHGTDGDPDLTLSLTARTAEQHQLTGGAADPAPLDMAPIAWAEAGAVRKGAAKGSLRIATEGLAELGLLRAVPAARLAAWSAAVLQSLDSAQRRTLEAYLRSGTAQAAAPALSVSENTVRTRLREISPLLAADLDHPTVQAQLLLALRVPPSPPPATSPARLLPGPPVPTELLHAHQARSWASALLEPLDRPLRIALRCWLQHHGRTAPAAAELGLARSTLTAWLDRCSHKLNLDLNSATARAELQLAIETVASPDDVPAALPRRGGRTYRGPRPQAPSTGS